MPHDALTAVFQAASASNANSVNTSWNDVKGPVAAALRTAARIGWTFESATTLVDDLGVAWLLLRDSPAAVGSGVTQSVSRWRFRSICNQFPAMRPPLQENGVHLILHDLSGAIRPLLARGAGPKTVPRWNANAQPWLRSAITGRQWPQARKAAVRSWEVDTSCQLCRTSVGTLEHRRVCSKTVPSDGWGTAPPRVAQFVASLGDDRRRLLSTRALLTVPIPYQPIVSIPKVWWFTEEPDVSRADIQWHTDGSVVNGTLGCPTAGCSLIATSNDGALVAVAQVALPSKIKTAPQAELQALLVLFQLAPFVSRVTTDCMSLVAVARGGLCKASAGGKTTAGDWSRLATYLDGSLQPLADGILVWAPAHCSLAVALTMRRSDGRLCTSIDWRANRLADAVAKAAARSTAPSRETLSAIVDARATLLHEAAILGTVTAAANNVRDVVTNADGSYSVVTRRDTYVPPRPADLRRPRRRTAAAATNEAQPLAIINESGCRLWEAHQRARSEKSSHEARRLAVFRRIRTETAALNLSATMRIVASAGAAAVPRPPGEARDRFEALRERIKTKSGANASL